MNRLSEMHRNTVDLMVKSILEAGKFRESLCRYKC